MKDKIMALDLGSTGIKVAVFDAQANILGSVYGEYKTEYPGPNMTLQSPTDWWNYFCDASKKLLAEHHISPDDIACVAPSGQMSALIPLDRDGTLLMDPCQIWADMRTTPQVREVAERFGGQEKVYYHTGIGLTEETFTGYKILWFRQNMPELFQKTAYYLQPKEYIGYKLTGQMATDFSDASETVMMDIKNRIWSKEILDIIGIDPSVLPPIRKSSDLLGHVTAAAAAATGLREGTPVCVGGGDVAIAASGAGVSRDGECYLYIGSGSWVGMCSDQPMLDYQKRIACICSTTTEGYTPHVVAFSGGLSQQWARELVNTIPGSDLKITYDRMDELARQSPIGAGGLIFLPYLRGGGAPTQNINARAGFVGLEPRHTYGDICRAILEGVAYIMREMVDILAAQTKTEIREVYLIGGGAKGSLWKQIIANVLQLPVVCTTMKQEANTWGAAKCGGVCVGLWKDFDQAQALVRRESVSIPDPAVKPIYDKLYDVFLTTYEQLIPVFDKLADCRLAIDAAETTL
ncbi:xylulokinase [Lawsonibacter celer]|uniref:xylulokinase n=1 Tax=Lawsonibacter celer TaxID=2986526 RepID=UPI0016441899|nr:FGGY-family carbohydrate kinase [Lawsonibacter celer]